MGPILIGWKRREKGEDDMGIYLVMILVVFYRKGEIKKTEPTINLWLVLSYSTECSSI
jgi:hypothetical protein